MSYLIVTSRCPISHEGVQGRETVRVNVGGVATALRRAMKQEGGTWVCWGDGSMDKKYPVEEYEGYRIVRVFMTPKERRGFYDDYANGKLWPLFHYFRGRMKNSPTGYSFYELINDRFAEAVAKEAKEDQVLWIHDYQLTLLPKMLRDRDLLNFIIFTWHIPWVASEFFATLPHAQNLMEGITASDMVTFHTDLYRKNFAESCESLLPYSEGLKDRLFTFSLGIDTSYYTPDGNTRSDIGLKNNRKLIFSIDRLDYTKGLTNRVMAIENLIKKYPTDAKKFTYVMIVTPSRSSVSEYREMRKELEMSVGRINGMHADLSWQPIIYMYRRVTDKQLMRYYRSADVGLITPLIDGLNLVSKEFVAATRKGVLILSKFAGSAYALDDAIKINPHDIDEIAEKIHHAMNMDDNEIKSRVTGLKESVGSRDLNWWLGEIKGAAHRLLKQKSEAFGDTEADQQIQR